VSTIFLTGATGYLGSYLAAELLRRHGCELCVLVRAESAADGVRRLWRAWQLHMDFERFSRHVQRRVTVVTGDLTCPRLGLSDARWTRLARQTGSVIHCAASLNRKSAKACFNVNLRGTLQVIKLARAAHEHHGLRRFSDISTVGVAGQRQDEQVPEDAMVDWGRSDYDPYGRTKKMGEEMVRELLADVPVTIFRPSTVLGDSRFAETTQFDMVRAFVFLARLPFLPFSRRYRMDIVNADYVARAVASIHQKDEPSHVAYNVSSGAASMTYEQIVHTLRRHVDTAPRLFLPWLEGPFGRATRLLASTPRSWGVALPASRMMVFWPYLTFNTTFGNTRVVQEMGGEEPVPFAQYAGGLMRFALEGGFSYPYQPWPAGADMGPSVRHL